MKSKSTRPLPEAKAKPVATKTVETKTKPKAVVPTVMPTNQITVPKKSVLEAAPAPVRSETPLPPQALPTTIVAKVDVGLGNQLFIRGEGGGLSWDKGEAMQCVDAFAWTWSRTTPDKLVFKILLNDQVWCQGENLVGEAGKKTELVPAF